MTLVVTFLLLQFYTKPAAFAASKLLQNICNCISEKMLKHTSVGQTLELFYLLFYNCISSLRIFIYSFTIFNF